MIISILLRALLLGFGILTLYEAYVDLTAYHAPVYAADIHLRSYMKILLGVFIVCVYPR